MSDPVITFLSDYGHDDEFVGVCHGVIARLCPGARVIDITHGIPRQDVRAGALALAAALPFMPPGVHLAVVDPGVGARGADARRAVAVRAGTGGALLVGPDNGLLAPAIAWFGEPVAAVEVSASAHRLRPVSATFHGRDLFAPVAAALACGVPLEGVGDPLDAGELVALTLPRAEITPAGVLVAHVLTIDAFGNVALDATPAHLAAAGIAAGQPVRVRVGERELPARHGAAFADVAPGALLVYEDARRMVALAVNRGSAARALALGPDVEVELAP